MPNERIRLVQGDTDRIPIGGGHGSSRATYMGGTAIWRASEEIIAKGTRIAADALEAAEADIIFEDGRFVVSGTDRALPLLDVAAIARDKGAPLDTYHAWTREWMTYPNGAHIAEAEIDLDTGQVTLARYTAVDDYGVLVNPMIATGQAHGAIAQGIGQALLEHAVYDPGSGQLLAGSFMDYPIPHADDLPCFELGFNNTRCTTNPLGSRRHCRFPGHRQRGRRRARRRRLRWSGDAGAHLARDTVVTTRHVVIAGSRAETQCNSSRVAGDMRRPTGE